MDQDRDGKFRSPAIAEDVKNVNRAVEKSEVTRESAMPYRCRAAACPGMEPEHSAPHGLEVCDDVRDGLHCHVLSLR